MISFKFSTIDEICQELGQRLKAQRLAQGMLQADLAVRAGVSHGTVKSIEKSGQSTLQSMVRIAQALGLEGEMQSVFVLQSRSIAEMERNEAGIRQRASRKQTEMRGK